VEKKSQEGINFSKKTMELLQRQIQFCQKNYLLFDWGEHKIVRISYMGLMDRFAIYPADSDEFEDIITEEDLLILLMEPFAAGKSLTIKSHCHPPPTATDFDYPLLGEWGDFDSEQAKKRFQELLTAYKDYCKSLLSP
jgi:hypothetical protein